MEESPFKTLPVETPSDILVVTCQFCPLEIPGHVDITRWPFWEQYNAMAVAGDGETPGTAYGFPAQQLRLWKKNGFLVAVAPMSSWPDVRNTIIQSGGRMLSQATALIRRPVDTARLNTYWLEKEQPVYIAKEPGAGRALSLPVGSCVLAVNCIPGTTDRQPENFHIYMVPEVHSALEDQRIVPKAPEEYFREKERPKVIFDSLHLSGTIRSDTYIIIACDPDTTAAGSLGSVFLARNTEEQNRQMIVVVSPEIQTGKRIYP